MEFRPFFLRVLKKKPKRSIFGHIWLQRPGRVDHPRSREKSIIRNQSMYSLVGTQRCANCEGCRDSDLTMFHPTREQSIQNCTFMCIILSPKLSANHQPGHESFDFLDFLIDEFPTQKNQEKNYAQPKDYSSFVSITPNWFRVPLENSYIFIYQEVKLIIDSQ
jgi:hypothetical protein